MRTEEKVGILFCCFNRRDYTKKALDALIKNTDLPHRIFIYDNGSTDGTREWLKKAKLNDDIEIYFSPERIPCDVAFNDFLEKTKDYIFLSKVDNDSILPPGWLSKMVDFVKKNNLMTATAMHYTFSRLAYNIMQEHAKRDYRRNITGGSGVVYRGELFDTLGGVKSINKWVDNIEELWGRASIIGARRWFNPDVFMELLDMAAPFERVEDYPDYNSDIEEARRTNSRTFGNNGIVVRNGKKIRTGFEITVHKETPDMAIESSGKVKMKFIGNENLQEYHGNGVDVFAGQTVEIEPKIAGYLLKSFPGVWEAVTPLKKDPEGKTEGAVNTPPVKIKRVRVIRKKK